MDLVKCSIVLDLDVVPTSPEGLEPGAVWRDFDVLRIVLPESEYADPESPPVIVNVNDFYVDDNGKLRIDA